jgi:phage tail sheath protein FI
MLDLPVGAPGVYIHEVTGPATISGAGTGTAAFIGPAVNGPFKQPVRVTNFDQFKRLFGRLGADHFPYFSGLGRQYFLAYGVQGFFENGGQQAVIVRVGTAAAAFREVPNGNTTRAENAFIVEAKETGAAGNQLTVDVTASTAVPLSPAAPSAPGTLTSQSFEMSGPPTEAFVVGDYVRFTPSAPGSATVDARVQRIQNGGNTIVLEGGNSGNGAVTGTLAVRLIGKDATEFRVAASPQLLPGALLHFSFSGTSVPAIDAYAYVDTVTNQGFVRLQAPMQVQGPKPPDPADVVQVAIGGFTLEVKRGATSVERQDYLSLSPYSQRYVFRLEFQSIRVVPPSTPPTAATIPSAQPATLNAAQLERGSDDNPAQLRATDYQNALAVLKSVDGINLVCVPDAAAAEDGAQITKAVVDHCVGCRDRFAILDVLDRADPLACRSTVTATGGFAALYYPQLLVEEQLTPELRRTRAPQIMAIPTCGHVAGVYARVDAEGVHVAPANQEIRGVLGVSKSMTNDEQKPLNEAGVNAIRVFADDGRVLVWGARTTAPAEQTDWLYVNVRRLLTFIELSLDRSLRWAVFRPNDRSLWMSLQVTISDFLRKQWRMGALVGANEAQAFRVRIDEGLNPPSEMALGKLNIEIRVAPSRPAEFIIINIGLTQQGTEIVEGA